MERIRTKSGDTLYICDTPEQAELFVKALNPSDAGNELDPVIVEALKA